MVEQADANSKRANAQRKLNEAQLDQQKALLAGLDVQEKQIQAQIRAAEAQVTLATDNLHYTRIVSPADGLVGQRQVRPGQFVNIGTQVIAVVPLPNVWVIANYKETQMTNVRLGQPAHITVDAFPDLVLSGHVDSWSPGTGSTFALLPPDNATGNFTKVVQRVPVKIALDKRSRARRAGAAGHVGRGDDRHRRRATDAGDRAATLRSSREPAPSARHRGGRGASPDRRAHPRLSVDTLRPYIGILGVLLGSIMATLGSRVTTFGIADLRGGLHLGFDEGAWMTTSFGVGQMLVGVSCPYLGAIFGVRRVLLMGIGLFFIASLLGPLSPNLDAFLAAQFLAGVGSGTFIPLTISFIARSLPTRLVIYGIAVYAMNSELSQNVGASLEGWYADNWSWRWIDWQYCVALPLMFACIWYGVPREKTNSGAARAISIGRASPMPASASACSMPASIRAIVSTGPGNGLVDGLLISGALVTLAFVLRELVDAQAFPECAADGEAKPAADPAAARRLPLHHPVDRLHHPELSPDGAEFSRIAGRLRAAVDRAAAIDHRSAAGRAA